MLYRSSIAIKQTQRLRKVTVQAYKKERQAYKLMIERYERGAMVSLPQMNGQVDNHSFRQGTELFQGVPDYRCKRWSQVA